jgi:hypothetical protein
VDRSRGTVGSLFGGAAALCQPGVVDDGEDEVTTRPRSRHRDLVLIAGLVVVLALLSIALVNALRPFGPDIEVAPLHPTAAKPFEVVGRCDAAITTAWTSDSKRRLWAVTVGTNMMGYTPVFGGSVKYVLLGKDATLPASLCRGEARHRLIVSSWFVLVALAAVAVTVVLARRIRRSTSAEPIAS